MENVTRNYNYVRKTKQPIACSSVGLPSQLPDQSEAYKLLKADGHTVLIHARTETGQGVLEAQTSMSQRVQWARGLFLGRMPLP